MKEFLEALGTRIKSPVLSYYSLSLVAFNWKPIFYLFFHNGEVIDRFTYFDAETSFTTLIIFPVLMASGLSLIYPWINYVFLNLCSKPTDLKNVLQARSEHKLIVKKTELEEARARLLATTEKELIGRAKRDEELKGIEDNGLREKLKTEIDVLRTERDKLTSSNPGSDNYQKYKELMEIASEFRNRANDSSTIFDSKRLQKKAHDIEEKAHEIIML